MCFLRLLSYETTKSPFTLNRDWWMGNVSGPWGYRSCKQEHNVSLSSAKSWLKKKRLLKIVHLCMGKFMKVLKVKPRILFYGWLEAFPSSLSPSISPPTFSFFSSSLSLSGGWSLLIFFSEIRRLNTLHVLQNRVGLSIGRWMCHLSTIEEITKRQIL